MKTSLSSGFVHHIHRNDQFYNLDKLWPKAYQVIGKSNPGCSKFLVCKGLQL